MVLRELFPQSSYDGAEKPEMNAKKAPQKSQFTVLMLCALTAKPTLGLQPMGSQLRRRLRRKRNLALKINAVALLKASARRFGLSWL
jgi:hypothetical protein